MLHKAQIHTLTRADAVACGCGPRRNLHATAPVTVRLSILALSGPEPGLLKGGPTHA
jgi:hypothetical protein